MNNTNTTKLQETLLRSGLSRDAIRAAWPAWWSEDAAKSPSAFNDLKFSLSRKLGIAPTSLFDEGDATFIWHGNAKFKGLDVQTDAEHQALVGYATAISKLVLSCSKFPSTRPVQNIDPQQLRQDILKVAPIVALPQLLGLAYNMGIPVLYLRVFPLDSKRMTAMSVKIGEQHLILIGRNAHQSAWLSFYIAHELAHIFQGHLGDSGALVDGEISGEEVDEEEVSADKFALTLLTGRDRPIFDVNYLPKSATQLASAVWKAGKSYRIDPGTLALCYAFVTKDWEHANGALKCLFGDGQELWRPVNMAASMYLDFSMLTEDNQAFLTNVLSLQASDEDSTR